ncbi:MAG: c-type cytochrome [Chitinophagaceae bacterium]
MKHFFRIIGLFISSFFLNSLSAAAQEVVAPQTSSSYATTWANAPFLFLLMTIIILLVVILIIGKIVKVLIEEDTNEIWKLRIKNKSGLILIGFLFSSLSLFAQETESAKPIGSSLIYGMEQTVFWVMLGVLLFEFITILVLCYILFIFLVRKGLIKPVGAILPKWLQFNTLMGNDIPIEKDVDMLTDHDYDGIQELDNGMPPFLKYMFVITIFFAIYYWVDYHVLNASPLQIEEYENQLAQGEADKLEYIKRAGAMVDENTVTLLSDASMIGNGEKIYASNCVACHGDKGQGGVGPNLTDNYWLHGSDIQSIFKTIKYGIPDKGMRSWQSDIKPGDIQAVSSYIIAQLKNKNVEGGKEPQGVPEAAIETEGKDSLAVSIKDSTTK